VSERRTFDYTLVRVVPRVERGEFVNAGVILYCRSLGFLHCRLGLDEPRLCALAPSVDLPAVRRALELVERVCAGDPAAGPVAALPQVERFHWLVAPRSTMVQTSPVHVGLCAATPQQSLDELFEELVRARD
jgi:hypothetical protein